MTSRRAFLQHTILGGAAAAVAGPLGQMNALAADRSGYKALVCVFLYGGMDGHDNVLPMDKGEYDAYLATRPTIIDNYAAKGLLKSRQPDGLLPLGTDGAGRSWGMAPQYGDLADVYDRGNLAVVGNVGPLEEVTDRAATQAKTAKLPPQLMSHNDQQAVWQTMEVEGLGLGWAGRMVDRMSAGPSSPLAAITFGRQASFLDGVKTRSYSLGTSKPRLAWGTYGNPFDVPELHDLLSEHYREGAAGMSNLYARDASAILDEAVRTNADLADIWDSSSASADVAVPRNHLSHQLAGVARMIALRGKTGLNRQVFFVQIGGLDTHEDNAGRVPYAQEEIGTAMSRFQAELERLGVANDVTTFTASEFGRTLQENDGGTDHGWGSHHFVMGGAVQGGRITGTMPPPTLKHDQDFGRGRLIPTTSLEQFGGELGRWFGLSDSELRQVFPNMGRFDPHPLGLF